MISYIKGNLAYISEECIIVECQNIGYEIRVPMSVVDALPGIGSEVKIFTYMYVREDLLCLYGFLNREDMELFKLLITVNGIGPKGALGILSTITPNDLRFAVLSGDVKTISKAPGIGAKTAGRMILDLKDKLKLEDAFEEKLAANDTASATGNSISGDTRAALRSEASQALMALGYSNTDAMKMVRQVEITDDMDVEAVLKNALKHMSSL